MKPCAAIKSGWEKLCLLQVFGIYYLASLTICIVFFRELIAGSDYPVIGFIFSPLWLIIGVTTAYEIFIREWRWTLSFICVGIGGLMLMYGANDLPDHSWEAFLFAVGGFLLATQPALFLVIMREDKE